MAYGYQLLLDVYGCEPSTCDDLSRCYQFLDDMVEHLGMRKHAPPSVFRTDATLLPHHAGLSGWAPLIESSLVIHTLSIDGHISLDVYSCRPFDHEDVVEFVRRFFSPASIDSKSITRGTRIWESQ